MQCVLAQLSLDNWNPLTVILTVCVSCYTLAQCTVMIIRAMRGDNTPTALEGQIAQRAAAHRTNATALNDLQRDFVPPEAGKRRSVFPPVRRKAMPRWSKSPDATRLTCARTSAGAGALSWEDHNHGRHNDEQATEIETTRRTT